VGSNFQEDFEGEERQKEDDQDLYGLTGDSISFAGSTASDKKFSIFQQLHENIRQDLTGNFWEIVNYNPLRFVIAHSDYNQIVYASVANKKNIIRDLEGNNTDHYEIIPQLKLRSIIVGAIPVGVTSHENPLFMADHRYTIRFSSHTGKTFTIGPKTLDEIVIELREKALIFMSRGATEALAIIIGAFARDKKIVFSSETTTSGFYLINGEIKAYRVDIPGQLPSEKKIRQCAELLDNLVTKYRRKEIIPTAIKWGVISPFNFVLKQYTNDSEWMPWLYPYGWTRTGKTTIGKIINGIWGKYSDRKYKIPFTSINSDAKFGFALSQTTYPITINEVGGLAEERNKGMLEMVKNSIETTIARSKHIHKTTYTDIPALCPCVLTSNSQPPRDPGFRSKITPIVFTKEDRHTAEKKAAFDLLISKRAGDLKTLGDFTTNYIMKNPNALLKRNKDECNWKETATVIISEFYKTAGLGIPNWINYFVEEEYGIIEDSIDDSRLSVRAFLINLINDTYNRYAKNFNDGITRNTLHMRFNFCCDNGLLPSISVTNKGSTVVIFGDIMKELRNIRSGIDCGEMASLPELANTIGLEYGQKWLNGKNTKVAYGAIAKFVSFLDSEIKDQDPDIPNTAATTPPSFP
jgi:hypothetical protein